MDYDLKKQENYYPQVFLRECKSIEKKVIRHMNGHLTIFFLMMSLMTNKSEWVKVLCKSIA